MEHCKSWVLKRRQLGIGNLRLFAQTTPLFDARGRRRFGVLMASCSSGFIRLFLVLSAASGSQLRFKHVRFSGTAEADSHKRWHHTWLGASRMP